MSAKKPGTGRVPSQQNDTRSEHSDKVQAGSTKGRVSKASSRADVTAAKSGEDKNDKAVKTGTKDAEIKRAVTSTPETKNGNDSEQVEANNAVPSVVVQTESSSLRSASKNSKRSGSRKSQPVSAGSRKTKANGSDSGTADVKIDVTKPGDSSKDEIEQMDIQTSNNGEFSGVPPVETKQEIPPKAGRSSADVRVVTPGSRKQKMSEKDETSVADVRVTTPGSQKQKMSEKNERSLPDIRVATPGSNKEGVPEKVERSLADVRVATPGSKKEGVPEKDERSLADVRVATSGSKKEGVPRNVETSLADVRVATPGSRKEGVPERDQMSLTDVRVATPGSKEEGVPERDGKSLADVRVVTPGSKKEGVPERDERSLADVRVATPGSRKEEMSKKDDRSLTDVRVATPGSKKYEVPKQDRSLVDVRVATPGSRKEGVPEKVERSETYTRESTQDERKQEASKKADNSSDKTKSTGKKKDESKTAGSKTTVRSKGDEFKESDSKAKSAKEESQQLEADVETITEEKNPEKKNFFRMCKCLVEHIPVILAGLLNVYISPKKLRSQLKKNKSVQLSYSQKHIIDAGKVPDYTKFDVTLFHFLFWNFCPKCPKPTHDWGTYPKADVEVTVGDDIERIRKFKNNAYTHLDFGVLPVTKFKRMWEELGELISRLEKLVKGATYKDKFDVLGKVRIDPLLDEEHVRTVKEWRDRDSELDVKMDDTPKQLEPELRKTKKSIDKMKKNTCSMDGILARSRHDPNSILTRMNTMEDNLLDSRLKVRHTNSTGLEKGSPRHVVNIQKIRESTSINVKMLDGMRDYTKALLNDFEEKFMPTFLETQNVTLAKRIFTEFGLVFLVGIPGEGKTMIGIHLLNQPLPDDVEQDIRLLITSPRQFKETVDPTRKYIIFVDDVFGKLCRIQSYIDEWMELFEVMMPLIQKRRIRVIMSSRLYMYKDCATLPAMRKHIKSRLVLNMSEREHRSIASERKQILDINIYTQKVLVPEEPRNIILKSTPANCAYPVCAKLLLTSRVKQAFRTPRQYFIEEFDNLFIANYVKYVALAVVFLVYTDIRYENHDQPRPLNVELKRLFNSKDLTQKAIENALRTMENVYVFYSKADKCYHFLHDVLHEAMFQSLSRHYPRKLTTDCPLIYINCFSITKRVAQEYDFSLNTEKDTSVHFIAENQTFLKARITQELDTKQPDSFEKVAGMKTWQVDEEVGFQDVFLKRDLSGVSLLEYAAKVSNVDLLQAILETVPIRSDEMATDIYKALVETCRRGSQRCFFCLLEECKRGMTTEMAVAAAAGGDVDILKYILQQVDFGVRNKDGDTLLMIASGRGHLNCVKLLTDIDFTLVQEVGNKNGGALHCAVQGQNDDVINCLIKRIVDDLSVDETDELLARTDSKGRTVLHAAVCEQNIGIAQILLDSFNVSYISITDNNGENVWHLAAYHSKEELVRFMLSNVSEIVSSIDDSGGTALHHAAAGGSVKIFNELLQAGLTPYGTTNDGTTVLHKAALHCKLEVVTYILQSMPDILQKKTTAKWTALHSAAAGGSVGVFNALLAAKMNPLDQTNDGCTVLHLSALNIHEELVRFLISNRKELVHLKNKNGETALHSSAVGGDINVFNVLLQAGLSPTDKTNEGKSPLQLAAYFGRVKLVKHIIEKLPDTVTLRDNSMRTALHYAAVNGNITIFADLLNAGLHPSLVTKDKVSVLHIASYSGNVALVRYIKRNYIDIFPLKDEEDRTALHAAAAGGNVTVFMELSRAELSATAASTSGTTALHIAAYRGNMKLLLEILDKFSEIVPLIDNQGNTAMHFAAAGGHIDICTELTKAGLSPTSTTNDGSTILHLAVGNGRVEMASHIINNITEIIPTVNKNGETVMHYAAAAGTVYVFHKLMEAGLSPDGRTKDGTTVLHTASFCGRVELVRHIISNVSNLVSTSDDSHWTALHSASAGGNVDTFAQLIRSGLSPKSLATDESTVLHLAAFNGNSDLCAYIKSNIPNIVTAVDEEGWNALHATASSGSVDTYKELVQAGISPLSKTKGDSTVLHVAAYYGHPELVKYIIKSTPNLVSMIDNAGRTALHDAAASGNMDVYTELKEAGLSHLTFPNDGTTVLHIAAENCHSDLARHIIIKTPEIVLYMDHQGKTALHSAAAGGTWALFKKICQFGISPKCATDNGSTVLHIAAEHGNVPLVKMLVQGLSDMVKSVDDEGRTAMHFAAAGGNADVFDLLITAGLIPEAAPNSSNSVLHVAAYKAHVDLVRYVIRKLPEMIPLTDESGWTALHYAAAAGNLQVFFILLKAGLSPRQKANDGSTVLHKAVFCGNLELVEFIIEVVPDIIPFSDASKWTAIHSSAAGGSVNVFTTLIGAGLSPMAVASGGSSVLHIAAYNGRFNLVEFIINHIQDIFHLIDVSGKTGLHYAAAGGNVKVFNELVHGGLSPQATTKDGSTVLHVAAANSRTALVQYIVENNPIIIPEKDNSGWTALHAAAAVGCINVISLLVEAGVSPGATTDIGRTILHVAAYKSKILLVRYIIKHYQGILDIVDDTGNTAMHSAVAGGNLGVFIELLHAGLSPQAATNDGSTILHIAANNGKADIVRYIIQYIDDIVSLTNNTGSTALHCAASGRNSGVFDQLCRAGLSPSAKTNVGKTALHEAAFCGKIELIGETVKKCPNILPMTDDSGRTALHYAAAGGSVQAFNALIIAGLSAEATAKDGSTVLHIASFNGNLELVIHVVDDILEIIPVIDNSGKTALHHAAAGGNVEVFIELLQAGLSAKTSTNDGSTVLHIASYNGKLDIVRYIIQATNDVLPLTDEADRTALHYAAAGGNVDVFIELVEAGLSPSLKTSSGSTVLHLASATSQLHLVNHILKTNQNFIYSTDSQGRTALHVAAGKNGSSDVFDILVQEGLSPMLKDKHGNTPLDLANTLIHQHVKKNHAEFHASYKRLKSPQPDNQPEDQTASPPKPKSKACVIQ